MSISLLEIYTQPDDLQINVAELTNGASGWAFLIARGPGHNFKPIVSNIEDTVETKEQAVDLCMRLLDNICSGCRTTLLDPTNFLHGLVTNGDGIVAPETEWKVLKQPHLNWIKTQLLTTEAVANTWEIPAGVLAT
jgi:hypothetical protein